MARSLMNDGEFIEVFVDTPIELCEFRDPKGLYRKARRQEITNFTGISSPYEPPESPEIRLETAKLSVEEAVSQLLKFLEAREGKSAYRGTLATATRQRRSARLVATRRGSLLRAELLPVSGWEAAQTAKSERKIRIDHSVRVRSQGASAVAFPFAL